MTTPVLYHYFARPLPYVPTLSLQEKIHQIQLSQRRTSLSKHHDILLLLQHRPVFTAGRRQAEADVHVERVRLEKMGADFASTARGGQLTYHGPGQLVGYPLFDLGRTSPPVSVRDYVCRLERIVKGHLREVHGIVHSPSEHTGVFVDEGRTKLASIGVQVRHRLTTHGFALNVTSEPLKWLDTVVACGLTDVKAGCIAGRSTTKAEESISVQSEVPLVVERFGAVFGREMQKLDIERSPEVGDAIKEIEELAQNMSDAPSAPLLA
ncbi:lipoyltransferase [Rickenella mellea]|uniref:lipoyl(octanoyl) transferase n=1 Tax=Rickenella mellea TaxID=50990 RepID=A0A4Y7Q4U3_9AGAM|nr:lipoyltransferase [Rickenella mellea]